METRKRGKEKKRGEASSAPAFPTEGLDFLRCDVASDLVSARIGLSMIFVPVPENRYYDHGVKI
jgi:hypothetical protein